MCLCGAPASLSDGHRDARKKAGAAHETTRAEYSHDKLWQPSLVFVLLVGEVNHHDTVHDHRQAEDRDRDDHQHEIHGRPRPHTESPFLNTALRFRCLLRLGIGTKCWKGQITATGAKPKTKDVSSRPAFESVVGVVAVGVL